MSPARPALAAVGLGLLLARELPAQVAFQPVPGVIPDGQTLAVTPVATANRRYVRLSVDPQFLGAVSFDTFPVPAAVGGGPGGPGALGGGRLGPGAGNAPVGAGALLDAGMDGLSGPSAAEMVNFPATSTPDPGNPFVVSADPFRRALVQAQVAPALRARPVEPRAAPRSKAARKRAAAHARKSAKAG